MPRQYPPHFRQEMIDRMFGGESVLSLVRETSVPEQTLHRWKHQALVDAGLANGIDSNENAELRAANKRIMVAQRFGKLRGEGLLGFGRFGRFLAVGLVNSGAGFFLFLFFFSALGFHYLVANGLVFVTWAWFGFELQRRWTFRARATIVAFGKFLVNQIAFLGLGSVLLWTLVETFTLRAEFAYLLTLGIVTAGMYLSSLLWVFRGTVTGRE